MYTNVIEIGILSSTLDEEVFYSFTLNDKVRSF